MGIIEIVVGHMDVPESIMLAVLLKKKLPGSNMSQIYTMAFLLSLVVMGTCVMMISSSLNSNVSQRMEFSVYCAVWEPLVAKYCALCAVRLYSGALPPYPLVSG